MARGRAFCGHASLIVLKEFPTRYRPALTSFVREGFTCVPSMPMTYLNIAYGSFDQYMSHALSSKRRMDLRKKFRIASRFPPIDMKVVQDIRAEIDEAYPLYVSVYERSKLRFEKLTKDYFCRLGDEMPDKVRYFIWRQNGRMIAFSLCMVDGESIYAEYLGLDYTVALDLHLYHYVFRDVVVWAMANGYKSFRSSGATPSRPERWGRVDHKYQVHAPAYSCRRGRPAYIGCSGSMASRIFTPRA
jgi:predicted N-acyltransferase